MDGTGAALGDAAAELGARHAQDVAQRPEERRVRRDVDGMDLAVYAQADQGEPSLKPDVSSPGRHLADASVAGHTSNRRTAPTVARLCGLFGATSQNRRATLGHPRV